MSYISYEYKNPSNDANVLDISARLISEQIEKENARGESADNRINILFCLIGIYASVILATNGVIFGKDSNPSIILKFIFIGVIILLVMSVSNALMTILVKQVDQLSPEMVNEIQSFSEIEALQYEVKWKIWQYNKLNESNTTKLFYLHRVQRNILLSILYLLIMTVLIYFNNYIHLYELNSSCLRYIEIGLGIIAFLFSIFINYLLEKFSFWNKPR
ncbi:hypothetical protein [Desulfosporosinus sp. FKA]|uniref:hypothetical protein n=1 Tax=Desulfosporosinus sp. FKA TaxID=1969834 RepID=UPI000B498E98|nr:hypothetical protein [Desulfosporosinus sp. FKA]